MEFYSLILLSFQMTLQKYENLSTYPKGIERFSYLLGIIEDNHLIFIYSDAVALVSFF